MNVLIKKAIRYFRAEPWNGRGRMCWIAGILVGLVLVQCGSKENVNRKELSSAESYEIAKQYIEKENYFKAINELKIVLRRFPDSDITDRVMLDLARAHYLYKEYTDAVYELKRLMRDHPNSPLTEDGQYYLGLCYMKQSQQSALDQAETKYALAEFKTYLEEYPDGKYVEEVKKNVQECREKLAKKQYDNARLYYRQKDYKAAAIYCNQVINTFADTSWKEKAVELLGLCEIRQKGVEAKQ